MTDPTNALGMLARKLGVLTEYADTRKAIHRPSAEAVIAVLRTLGVDIDDPDDADDLLRAHRNHNRGIVAPVAISWDGEPTTIEIAAAERLGAIEATLEMEDGSTVDQFSSPVVCAPGLNLLSTPPGLPMGYHTLHVRAGSTEGSCTIISAPMKTWTDPAKRWIGFLPLYSLHSKRNPVLADLTDLSALGEWLNEVGGGLVGTLPLLAAFLEPPLVEDSPYAPVSRLAWNELYLDAGKARTSDRAPDSRIVDYERAYAAKRPLIAAAAGRAFDAPTTKDAIARFIGAHPHFFHYARFRAATSLTGAPWTNSDAEMANLYGTAFDDLLRFHQFAQWEADRQMNELAQRSAGLYLDFPIGVHSRGFDTWRYPDQFVLGASAGAPSDDYFDGQFWGFPPLHPRNLRDNAYAYLRQTLAHHMRHASILRFDHILGLHRMYFIPDGFTANEGTYVEYPADELYAVLSIESHRNRTMIIGEDLGTVPPYVPEAMAKHGIGGMFVETFSLRSRMRKLPVAPDGSLASIGTHDTPPFARWWRGADIDDRITFDMLTAKQANVERRKRDTMIKRVRTVVQTESPADVQRALTDSMARSQAALVLVNLEDLWHEEEPQNIPGTDGKRANWRRRSALSLEEMYNDPNVNATLRRVAKLRKEASA